MHKAIWKRGTCRSLQGILMSMSSLKNTFDMKILQVASCATLYRRYRQIYLTRGAGAPGIKNRAILIDAVL